MPDKSEKERRKQILNELSRKAAEEFESSLPMDRKNFKNLFDFLDKELGRKGCDDTNLLTQTFLRENNIGNTGRVLEWLAEQGGYCDCEILANVEEQFE
jgi:hypothetical protein